MAISKPAENLKRWFRGFRAAGNALGSNPLPIVLPCHRVLHSGGGLGGYTGGLERKRTLLAIERTPHE